MVQKAGGQTPLGQFSMARDASAFSTNELDLFAIHRSRQLEVMPHGRNLLSIRCYDLRPIVIEIFDTGQLHLCVLGQNLTIYGFDIYGNIFVPRSRRTDPQPERFVGCMTGLASPCILGDRMRLCRTHIDRELAFFATSFCTRLGDEDGVQHYRLAVFANNRNRRLAARRERSVAAFTIDAEHRLFPT